MAGVIQVQPRDNMGQALKVFEAAKSAYDMKNSNAMQRRLASGVSSPGSDPVYGGG